jgi:crotonobetainyl-CoA:carnitine CoA-transferase CaiB-like acyl-CoA transferase
VRVVELGVWVAGPAAGGIMADWGADVIKVEPAGGDPQRAVFGSVGLDGTLPVPPFEVDNRGKRSMVLDLRDFDDHAIFDRLLSTADVLVTNMRPGALERLELGPDRICARHPHLVYGAITGYGFDGEPIVTARATTSVRSGRDPAWLTRWCRRARCRPDCGRGWATTRPE